MPPNEKLLALHCHCGTLPGPSWRLATFISTISSLPCICPLHCLSNLSFLGYQIHLCGFHLFFHLNNFRCMAFVVPGMARFRRALSAACWTETSPLSTYCSRRSSSWCTTPSCTIRTQLLSCKIRGEENSPKIRVDGAGCRENRSSSSGGFTSNAMSRQQRSLSRQQIFPDRPEGLYAKISD